MHYNDDWAAREAYIANQVAEAMRERDRMRERCECEWDEDGYTWVPGCPEHNCPEDADDEAWENWFAGYEAKRERKAFRKYDRIAPLFRGLSTIYAVIYATSRAAVRGEIADARERYAVLYALRAKIQDEIVSIAQEI
jgi:hypothetical protein